MEQNTNGDSVAYRMAYVLLHWPADEVPRRVLRDVLPEGATRRMQRTTVMARKARRVDASASQNLTTRRYKATLARWESHGLLERRGDCVMIRNREAFRRGASQLPEQIAAHVRGVMDLGDV